MQIFSTSASPRRQQQQPQQQRGGTFLGLILGVLIGLFAALAVALYVTKVPIPIFAHRGDNSTEGSVDQDLQKNKDWNPNANLNGKNTGDNKTVSIPDHPASAANAAATDAPVAAEKKPTHAPSATAKPKPTASSDANAQAASGDDDPLADLVKKKSENPQASDPGAPAPVTVEPFIYYVQIGAFIDNAQAESLKAQAAMAGMSTDISQREQAGRQIFRVRLGPFNTKDAAEKAKARVEANNMTGALVRVQR